ncbi:MAG: TlpA disulfide reductase family protein [Terriglobia bacterium]
MRRGIQLQLWRAWLLLLLSLTACSCTRTSSQGPVVQGDGTDFTFSDQSGNTKHLSDLRGKVVLVNFWATWCPPCREEMPSLEALQNRLGPKNLAILALSVDDSWKTVRHYMESNHFTIPVYSDFDKKIASRYGTYMYPETYLVDKEGKVAYKVVGAVDWTSPEMLKFIQVLLLEGQTAG